MNLILIVGAVVGYIFLTTKKPTSATANKPTASKTVAAQAQPSATANQPWYGGAASALGVPQNLNLSNASQLLGGGSSIVHSLSDIFGTVSPTQTFGPADNPDILMTADNGPATFDSNDPGMGSLDTEPSGFDDNTQSMA